MEDESDETSSIRRTSSKSTESTGRGEGEGDGKVRFEDEINE